MERVSRAVTAAGFGFFHRRKLSKVRIQLLCFFYGGNGDHKLLRVQRDRFDHQGEFFFVKTIAGRGFLHNFMEQVHGCLIAVSKLFHGQPAFPQIG